VPAWGKGSTFSVRLPIADARRNQGTSTRPEDGASPEFHAVDLRGVRVLVVDDQRDACELVERVLEECGAWVVTAPGGQVALDVLPEARPNVLISDIGMPGMDGYELLRRVRELEDASLQRVPAIAMTAFARSEDRTRALRSGFQVHISKPVEPSELVATVASVTGKAAAGV
jgi:CheY-like chemotaxis protein